MSLTRFAVGTAVLVSAGIAVTVIGSGAPAVRAQQTPPAARVYGSIQINGQNAPSGAVVTAFGGATLCGTANGAGLYTGSQYFVDIDSSQAACATPGNTLTFKVNGQAANENAKVPQIAGSPVQLNLTVAPATPAGPSMTYKAGWNLVGGPTGMVLAGASGKLYNYNCSIGNYDPGLDPATAITASKGYWAFFAADTTLAISGSAATLPVSVSVAAGCYAMVGNPGTTAVTASGADFFYTYDPVAGYSAALTTATLQPGQGAWAYSAAGGTVTIK